MFASVSSDQLLSYTPVKIQIGLDKSAPNNTPLHHRVKSTKQIHAFANLHGSNKEIKQRDSMHFILNEQHRIPERVEKNPEHN